MLAVLILFIFYNLDSTGMSVYWLLLVFIFSVVSLFPLVSRKQKKGLLSTFVICFHFKWTDCNISRVQNR